MFLFFTFCFKNKKAISDKTDWSKKYDKKPKIRIQQVINCFLKMENINLKNLLTQLLLLFLKTDSKCWFGYAILESRVMIQYNWL